jgi:xanthine/CO dehydrogenase XdhC/CoxF family maturation factor
MTWKAESADRGRPDAVSYFLERLKKPTHLHLFGAGPDADAVYELTVALGWEISIYDHRRALLAKGRFPKAFALSHTYYEDDWSLPVLDASTPCVVMTHNLPRDLLLVPKLLAINGVYVGVLGAQKRAAMIRDGLEERGFSQEQLLRLHSPVGLDIGAQEPWTIALSILAEIQSWSHNQVQDENVQKS